MTDISRVPGNIARTHIPAGARCMPRNENGSPHRAATTASTFGSRCRSTLGRLHLGQNAEDAVQRNVYPARTIGQFIRYLVDCLFEREECQHRPCLRLAHRISRASAHRFAISGAKTVHRPYPPGFGQLRHPGRRCRTRLGELPHRREAGVIKRSNHSGDIAQWRALAPAVGQRPRRLTLEIDDEEIVLYDQHLAEVEIPVESGLLRLDLIRDQLSDLTEEAVTLREQALDEFLAGSRQVRALALQFRNHVGGGGFELTPPFDDIAGGYRLRGEIGIVMSVLSKSAVHLGGAQAELTRQ